MFWKLDLGGCSRSVGVSRAHPGNESFRMEEGSQQTVRTQVPMEISVRDSGWLFLYCRGALQLAFSHHSANLFSARPPMTCLLTQWLYFNLHPSVALSTINLFSFLKHSLPLLTILTQCFFYFSSSSHSIPLLTSSNHFYIWLLIRFCLCSLNFLFLSSNAFNCHLYVNESQILSPSQSSCLICRPYSLPIAYFQMDVSQVYQTQHCENSVYYLLSFLPTLFMPPQNHHLLCSQSQ